MPSNRLRVLCSSSLYGVYSPWSRSFESDWGCYCWIKTSKAIWQTNKEPLNMPKTVRYHSEIIGFQAENSYGIRKITQSNTIRQHAKLNQMWSSLPQSRARRALWADFEVIRWPMSDRTFHSLQMSVDRCLECQFSLEVVKFTIADLWTFRLTK